MLYGIQFWHVPGIRLNFDTMCNKKIINSKICRIYKNFLYKQYIRQIYKYINFKLLSYIYLKKNFKRCYSFSDVLYNIKSCRYKISHFLFCDNISVRLFLLWNHFVFWTEITICEILCLIFSFQGKNTTLLFTSFLFFGGGILLSKFFESLESVLLSLLSLLSFRITSSFMNNIKPRQSSTDLLPETFFGLVKIKYAILKRCHITRLERRFVRVIHICTWSNIQDGYSLGYI